MRDFFGSIGYTFWGLILCLIVVFALFAMWAGLLPLGFAVQRDAIQNSQGYSDGLNMALQNYIQEYDRLATKITETNNNDLQSQYRGQQKAILNSMCQTKARMKSNTIAPDALQFFAQNGGCR